MLVFPSDLSSAGRITVLSPVSVSEADTYWNSVQTIREDLDVLLEQSHSFPSLKAHFPGVELNYERTYRNAESLHSLACFRLPGPSFSLFQGSEPSCGAIFFPLITPPFILTRSRHFFED